MLVGAVGDREKLFSDECEISILQKEASYNSVRETSDMRTIGIQYLLVEQKTRLQIGIDESGKKKTADALSSAKNLVVQIRCMLLTTLCEALRNVHLLKTALFVTKKATTTIRSLSRNYFKSALVKEMKERTFKAVKEIVYMLKSIQDALVGELI